MCIANLKKFLSFPSLAFGDGENSIWQFGRCISHVWCRDRGGMELAAATHVRIAEPSTIFQLPEGRRGIFVGGGATARVGRIIGPDRMTEMMLTGRKYSADEGLALDAALFGGWGEAMALAQTLAGKISRNAPFANMLMLQAIPRINDMGRDDGLFAEALAASMSQTTPDAQEGLRAFWKSVREISIGHALGRFHDQNQ